VSAYRALSAPPLAIPLLRTAAVAVLASTAIVVADEALSSPLRGIAAAWDGVALAAWCGALLAACSALTGRDGPGAVEDWFVVPAVVRAHDGLASISSPAWPRKSCPLASPVLSGSRPSRSPPGLPGTAPAPQAARNSGHPAHAPPRRPAIPASSGAR
jgi:hypothetical protein